MNKKTNNIKMLICKIFRKIFFKIIEYAIVCLVVFVIFSGIFASKLFLMKLNESYIMKKSYVTKTDKDELFFFLEINSLKGGETEVEQIEIFDKNMNLYKKVDKPSLYQELLDNAIILKVQNCPKLEFCKIKITFQTREVLLAVETKEYGMYITEVNSL
ncbi:MAG: hypothetical protein P1P64_08985 [Treponemataceae bacterium]